MHKIIKVYSCYQCNKFIRIKELPVIKDLGLDIEGVCYGHKDMHTMKGSIAKAVIKVSHEFPDFCGLDDPD